MEKYYANKQIFTKSKKKRNETIVLRVITFEPIRIQTHSALQNDSLKLSFVKDVHVIGGKMARNGLKTAIYQSQILGIRLYIILGAPVSPIPPVLQKGKGGSTQAGSCTIVLASECLISELLYTQKLFKTFCASWTSSH